MLVIDINVYVFKGVSLLKS